MVQCSAFLLHGRNSTRSSLGRWKHFSVMSVPILATTMSPSDAFGVRFTATMSPDWYPTEDMLSPRTTTSMVALSDQLARRSRVVHFPPYDLSDESDLNWFQSIFGQLVAALPFSDPERSWSVLQEHLLDVGVGSAGCVGVLKEWLGRALQAALATGVEFVDWERMEQTGLTDVDLFRIAHPIHEYRTAKRPSRADVERLLGVSRPVAPSSGKAGRPRAKPGRRKPVRDPVGVDAAVKSA